MNAEEKLLYAMFSTPHKTKNIDDLTVAEVAKCRNGYNNAIEIIIDGEIVVTGGTLFERCLLSDSDINTVNTLKETTTEEILDVVNEEGVTLYVFEDVILVLSDEHFVAYESKTWCLPISTDLSLFEGTGVEINDLR